ncbi:MAG: tetratricopeptide repeat protein [bacterium]|nr:tetratricopeptide repeat protein [bacterium]
MQKLRFPTAVLAVAILAMTVGCAPPATEEVAETAAVMVEEIPITTNSDAARALFEEGEYLLDVGRGVEARAKFQAAIAEDPGFVRAHFNQSNTALSFKEFQTCLDMASEHLTNASEGEKMMVEINRTFLTNDTEKGVELGRQLAESHPNSPRAHLILAGLLGGQNDNEGARAAMGAALRLDADSPGALFGIANNYLFGEPKDFTKAEEWAQKTLAAFPDEAKGWELMGDIRRAQLDLEGALGAYEKATEVDASLAVAQHKKGHVNSFLGNIEAAREAYDAGVAAAPAENKAAYAVYKTYTGIHAGDIPAALAEMEELAENIEAMGTPADQVKGLKIFALNSHATAAMHAGLLDRAAKSVAKGNELRMAIAEDVGTDDARRLQESVCHLWDGLLAAYQGDGDAAAIHAGKIEELVAEDDNPRKMEPAHYVLGMAALSEGDHETAAQHLRQANYKNNMFIRYQLALAEEALGNTEEAKKLFGEVGNWNFNSVGFALVHKDAKARAAA